MCLISTATGHLAPVKPSLMEQRAHFCGHDLTQLQSTRNARSLLSSHSCRLSRANTPSPGAGSREPAPSEAAWLSAGETSSSDKIAWSGRQCTPRKGEGGCCFRSAAGERAARPSGSRDGQTGRESRPLPGPQAHARDPRPTPKTQGCPLCPRGTSTRSLRVRFRPSRALIPAPSLTGCMSLVNSALGLDFLVSEMGTAIPTAGREIRV